MTAINQKIRRLPGFRFEAQTVTREDVLPRMDIALFVGFASTGPIGIPVMLESAEQFKAIFGEDLPLVRDKEKSEMIYAFLAPTVRMFFRNGGKRCWVIRTARVENEDEKSPNRAAYNIFPMTGLATLRFDGENLLEIIPAFARARSKGSWSDDIEIATATVATALKFKKIENSDEGKILFVETSANDLLKVGDLLRLTFPNSVYNLILSADKIEPITEAISSPSFSPTTGRLNLKITTNRFVWLENLTDENFQSPPIIQIKIWKKQSSVGFKNISESALEVKNAEIIFEKQEEDILMGEKQTKVHLKFLNLSVSDAPDEGSLLIAEFQDKLLCLQVESVISPKTDDVENAQLICKGVLVFNNENLLQIASPDFIQSLSAPGIERLTFELWIKNGEKILTKLNDLAFNSPHERFWGNLSVDEDLYDFSENENTLSPENPSRLLNAQFPKSPIAGNGDRDGFYIPVFPTSLVENYLGAIEQKGTKLQRDGLEVFDEKLFLDKKLKNTGLNNLLNEAEFIRFLSPNPRRLWGIHNALAAETVTIASAESLPTNPVYTSYSLDEATIIAVPDALHRGWFHDDEKGSITKMPNPFDAPLRPEWWSFQDCRDQKFKSIEKPLWGNFLNCDLKIIDAPQGFDVEGGEISSGTFTLIWEHDIPVWKSEKEKVEFVVEESSTPGFESPLEIYRNTKKKIEIQNHGAGIFYYRVRAEIGKTISNWSEGLAIKIPAGKSWAAKYLDEAKTSDAEKTYSTDVLLAVQRAILRMCAARGDMFAVLDLPEHFEKEDAVRYVSTLKATKGTVAQTVNVEPFSSDEKTALSFGAVYHPWLLTRAENFESVKSIPSGGAVCGVFSTRSLQRGAWIAPANEALKNVLGLTKDFGIENFLDFQDAQINLVRHEPTGFLVLDSDTLSDDFDLLEINVRRLLCLLRRLALKHGAEYVFEPNNESFRRSVQRGFNALLDKMFTRGAFAGNTPAKSYQVVVSETVNNFQSLEQGRFIVELRVAPSLPLKFVTVRLINSGGRTSVSETV